MARPRSLRDWFGAGNRPDVVPRAERAYIHFQYRELAECVVPMGEVVYRPFNLDPTERFCLAALAVTRGVKSIFEFGTYDGATTLLLARSVPDARIFTLDLPEDQVGEVDAVAEQQLAVAGGLGSKFRLEGTNGQITQLVGDSRLYDFTPYLGAVDLVLVDGGHSYECIRSDSENALRMLAPGGLVVWDDYTDSWPAVVRAVDDVATASRIRVMALFPTEFAVYDSALS